MIKSTNESLTNVNYALDYLGEAMEDLKKFDRTKLATTHHKVSAVRAYTGLERLKYKIETDARE